MTCFALCGLSSGDVYFAIECNNGITQRLSFGFCTVTNQFTIDLQIIILLLHVSTLLCHPQGAPS